VKIRSPGFRIRSSYETVFSGDGQHLLVVGRDIVLWRVRDRVRLRSTRKLAHPSSIDFAPDAGGFIAKNAAGELVRFDTATFAPQAWHSPPGHDEGAGPVYVNDVSIVDGSWEGTIRMRDPRDLLPRIIWSDNNSMVTRIARCGTRWAALVKARHTHPKFELGADKVLLGDVLGEPPLWSPPRTWRFLRGMALSPAADRLAVLSGAPARDLEIVETSTGSTIAAATADAGGTGGHLAWSSDGTILVVAEAGGFSFRSTLNLREMGWFPSRYAAHASFAPDGSLICLGDWKEGAVLPWPGAMVEYAVQRSDHDAGLTPTSARQR
jgi:hypothetical protein